MKSIIVILLCYVTILGRLTFTDLVLIQTHTSVKTTNIILPEWTVLIISVLYCKLCGVNWGCRVFKS